MRSKNVIPFSLSLLAFREIYRLLVRKMNSFSVIAFQVRDEDLCLHEDRIRIVLGLGNTDIELWVMALDWILEFNKHCSKHRWDILLIVKYQWSIATDRFTHKIDRKEKFLCKVYSHIKSHFKRYLIILCTVVTLFRRFRFSFGILTNML